MSTEALAKAKAFPVMEQFGGTVQGEGALAGLPTYFIRFGGCDYQHCSWCDSLHAVIPERVRENSTKMTAEEIIAWFPEAGPQWVTLSGGNPALLQLGGLVAGLHERGFLVAIETQGSRWKPWLADLDCLTVSPKPPSSLMVSDAHSAEYERFMDKAEEAERHLSGALKIVVFDDTDLAWARARLAERPSWPAYLSVGTEPPVPGEPLSATLAGISDRYRWLCERIANDPDFAAVRVLPQCHVIAWGHSLGV